MTTKSITAPEHQIAKLKAGTHLYRSPVTDTYLIGTRRTRVEIISTDAPALFALLSAGCNRSDLNSALVSDQSVLESLLIGLSDHGLLETETSTLEVSQRFVSQITERAEKFGDRSKDAAFSQLRNRISPELTLTRWLPEVNDSGIAKVSARQSAHIEISGNSRAALHLFSQLVASGVTDTQFAPTHRRNNEQVSDLDISGGYIAAKDIGQIFVKASFDAAKSLSLFPVLKESAEEVSSTFFENVIKVHFGEIDSSVLALWMAAGQSHIIVSEINGAKLTISQLVKPGITPCTRCFELSLIDQFNCELVEATSFREEIPIIGAHFISALIAAQVLSLIDTGSATLSTNAIAIDLTDLSNAEHIAISRHPLCGCSW